MFAQFLFVALLSLASAQEVCGPADCYPAACRITSIPVDIVFFFDTSGSMSGEISTVTSAMQRFAEKINAAVNIDARFGIVRFGDCSTDPSVFSGLNTIANLDLAKKTNGAHEASSEALLASLQGYNEARTNTYSFKSGPNIGWRAKSKKIFILLTDEDSDIACYNKGDYTAQGTELNAYCNGGWGSYSQNSLNSFAKETKNVADNFIASARGYFLDASGNQQPYLPKVLNAYAVYMLVPANGYSNSNQCLTYQQFGDPSKQVEVNGKFNTTLTIKAYDTSAVMARTNLQRQLLEAGMVARVLNIEDANSGSYLDDLWSDIVADVAICDNKCFDFVCKTDGFGLPTSQCAAPINMCDCAGRRGGNAVFDNDGICCDVGNGKAIDCAGYCYTTGTAPAFDFHANCNVCVAKAFKNSVCTWSSTFAKSACDTGFPSMCVRDCAGNYYLNSKPTTDYKVSFGAAAAPTSRVSYAGTAAGFLLANPDLSVSAVSDKATFEANYESTWMFQTRWYCAFDLAAYNTLYMASFTLALAEANWLTSSPLKTAKCIMASSTTVAIQDTKPYPRIPPAFIDACGNCQIATQGLACASPDCAGNRPVAFSLDTCGRCNCVGAATSACNAATLKPSFNSERWPYALTCQVDCAGLSYTAPASRLNKLNECGQCVASTVTASGKDGCGICMNSANYDANDCKVDCMGFQYLLSTQAITGIVAGLNIATMRFYTPMVIDPILGTTSTVTSTIANFIAANGHSPSKKDTCGVCYANYENSQANNPLYLFCDECCSHVNFPSVVPNKDNICVANVYDDFGRLCLCITPYTCPDMRKTCVFESFPVANSNQTNVVALCVTSECELRNPLWTLAPDDCGWCQGDPMYGKTDDCGLCCEGEFGVGNGTCNANVDECGICFGLGKSKDNECNQCETPGNKCILGCDDKWCLSDACPQYDCKGVCAGDSMCTVCGDGEVAGEEQCDLGPANGAKGECLTDCTLPQAAGNGATIAAIVSVIAALCLAASVFFAYKYAAKNGLLGKASGQVDMGAANANPLYDSQTQIRSNPLYSS